MTLPLNVVFIITSIS